MTPEQPPAAAVRHRLPYHPAAAGGSGGRGGGRCSDRGRPAALSEGGDGHSDLPTAAAAVPAAAVPVVAPASLALQGTITLGAIPASAAALFGIDPTTTNDGIAGAAAARAHHHHHTSALAPAAKLLLGGDGHSELGGGGVPAAPCDDDFDDDDDAEEEEEEGATPEQRQQGTTRRRRRWSRGISGVQAMFASLSPSASPQGTGASTRRTSGARSAARPTPE